MKKSEIKITHKVDKIIIRKPIGIIAHIIMSLIASILLLFCVFSKDDSNADLLVFLFFAIFYIANILDSLICKIIIDISEKKLCVCDWFAERCNWCDIEEFKTFSKSDGDGGTICKLFIVLKSGHIIDFRTNSSTQSQELVELLQSIVKS